MSEPFPLANPAPVVAFVFSRPSHTQRMLECLAANDIAKLTPLIVYSDGPRSEADVSAVAMVRALVRRAKGFASVEVIERQTNYGLARNIIEGVSEVCSRHGRAIVLEDDILTSTGFLTFMNDALRYYFDDRRVWHISGWNYPIDVAGLGPYFFHRVMNCWGWATWADRWAYYTKDPEKLIAEFDAKMIREFDLNDSGVFWSQVLLNRDGKLNTWAVFWYATIFRNGGLCLNPAESYVNNIGFDGTGVHGKASDMVHATPLLSRRTSLDFTAEVRESPLATERIKQYYLRLRPSQTRKLVWRLRSVLRRVLVK